MNALTNENFDVLISNLERSKYFVSILKQLHKLNFLTSEMYQAFYKNILFAEEIDEFLFRIIDCNILKFPFKEVHCISMLSNPLHIKYFKNVFNMQYINMTEDIFMSLFIHPQALTLMQGLSKINDFRLKIDEQYISLLLNNPEKAELLAEAIIYIKKDHGLDEKNQQYLLSHPEQLHDLVELDRSGTYRAFSERNDYFVYPEKVKLIKQGHEILKTHMSRMLYWVLNNSQYATIIALQLGSKKPAEKNISFTPNFFQANQIIFIKIQKQIEKIKIEGGYIPNGRWNDASSRYPQKWMVLEMLACYLNKQINLETFQFVLNLNPKYTKGWNSITEQLVAEGLNQFQNSKNSDFFNNSLAPQ